MATDPSQPVPPPESRSVPVSSVPGVDCFAHFLINRTENGELDTLGRGSMGLTYRAFDTRLERDVALKVINPDRVHDPEMRSRFFREARAAARLQHPNIANVLYQGQEGDACFYVMELVPGEDLHHYIQRVGPISPVHALRMAHQIALALDVASQESILHRDLKPGNVMLTSYHEGGAPHVKVIDFGLAKLMSENNVSYTTGGFVGTPEFASPEQCEERELDARSDIYSLGATLWFLLSGRAPFSGSLISVIQAQVHSDPPFETLIGAPKPLLELLQRFLAKDPDDRPPAPLQAARDIEELVAVLSKDPANFDPLPVPVDGEEKRPSRQAGRAISHSSRVKRRTRLSSLGWIVVACVVLVVASLAGWLFRGGRTSREPTAIAAAAPGLPVAQGVFAQPAAGPSEYLNSLGMKFVQIPNGNVLMSIWETRVQDFEAFAKATNHQPAKDPSGTDRNWQKPGFEQGKDHPVVNVSWEEAVLFCQWLTSEERAAGRIRPAQFYRLPQRYEWDVATGMVPPGAGPPGGGNPGGPSGGPGGPGGGAGPGPGAQSRPAFGGPAGFSQPENGGPPPDAQGRPEFVGQERPPNQGQPPPGPQNPPGGPPFHWGLQWPPIPGSGNFADAAALKAGAATTVIEGYNDGYAFTAPVGKFKTVFSPFYDLSGNVWEICQDGPPQSPNIMIQGGSWASSSQASFRMQQYTGLQPNQREPFVGFRCVLVQ